MRSIPRWCVAFALAVCLAASIALPLAQARGDASPAAVAQRMPEVAAADLPREARETLRLIKQGGRSLTGATG